MDRASRDVTEVGRAVGQERATPPIDREKRKKTKTNKRSKTERGREKEKTKHKKDRKKVIYNDKNHSCKARNGTACIKQVCTQTHIRTITHTQTHAHAHTGMQKKMAKPT